MPKHLITSLPSNRRAISVAILLGTTSFATLTSIDARAQVQEVLITGSLIAGTEAVGVPVTAVTNDDFLEAGTVSVTQFMQTIPALDVMVEASSTFGGGRTNLGQNVQIHGIGTGDGVETLLMINGLRFPPQNYAGETVDPSIISQIGTERVDILTAGASAVYGSDATTGVINIILRRGYEGAMTRVRGSGSTDYGDFGVQVSQLWGTNWDTGGITLSYEWTDEPRVEASKRHYFTQNLEPYGLNDSTPLGSSVPGVVSTGRPQSPDDTPGGFDPWLGTRFCENCYNIPQGVGWDYGAQEPGPTTSWDAIIASPFVVGQENTQNQRNTWLDGWSRPHMQLSLATLTFDQELVDDLFGLGPVSLFVDAFYGHRQSIIHWPPSNNNAFNHAVHQYDGRNVNGLLVPVENPYRPTDVPDDVELRVHYGFGPETPLRNRGNETAGRYAFGFNFDQLPFDFQGKLTYSMTQDTSQGFAWGGINENHKSAALGNFIEPREASTGIPEQGGFTKPDGIPYLNVFCDSTIYRCNSQATIDYITGERNQEAVYKIQETGAQVDGPILDLPGGPVLVALAYQHLSRHLAVTDFKTNEEVHSTAFPERDAFTDQETSYAIFGQLNVPLLGEGFNFPLFESLDVEAGYRYDNYEGLDKGVFTPKVAVNWGVGYGLTLRGTWGEAFRTPSFSERSNRSGGVTNNDLELDCVNPAGSPQGVALAGSLTAVLNPNCDPDLASPPALEIAGNGGGVTQIIREHAGYEGLTPQTVKQWNMGFNFAPTEGFLAGLNLDAQLFHMKFNDLITNSLPGEGVNDPLSRAGFVLPSDVGGQAAFDALLQRIVEFDDWEAGGTPDVNLVPDVLFIFDNALRNIGRREVRGIDFNGRYDWEMGNLGAFHVGAIGYYEIYDRTQADSSEPVDDAYEGKNSGNRLQRVRYRGGWTNGTWDVTMFANYRGHSSVNVDGNDVVPPCYYAPGFGPGSCYPGSPYHGPTEIFPNYDPATVTFDLSIGYQTGLRPSNEYLQNIGIQLTVNNILNKEPPFSIGSRGVRRGTVRDLHAISNAWSDRQRFVSLALTKEW